MVQRKMAHTSIASCRLDGLSSLADRKGVSAGECRPSAPVREMRRGPPSDPLMAPAVREAEWGSCCQLVTDMVWSSRSGLVCDTMARHRRRCADRATVRAGGLPGGKDPAGRFALGVVTSVMNGFAACFARTPNQRANGQPYS